MNIFGVVIPEGVVIALSGILGGIIVKIVDRLFSKPKDIAHAAKIKADTISEYVATTSQSVEALTKVMTQRDALQQKLDGYDKAFDRIREQFKHQDELDLLRRKEQDAERARHDDLMRQKEGENLVMRRMVEASEKKANQLLAERAGYVALSQNVSQVVKAVEKLKEDTGELKIQMGNKAEEKAITYSTHTQNLPPLPEKKK